MQAVVGATLPAANSIAGCIARLRLGWVALGSGAVASLPHSGKGMVSVPWATRVRPHFTVPELWLRSQNWLPHVCHACREIVLRKLRLELEASECFL